MRVLLLIAFIYTFSVGYANNNVQFDLLKCERYTIEDGLPQSFIEEIFQDKKGFLWIATQDGVSKFNGYDFFNYFSDPFDDTSINSNYVRKIESWNQDSILFTTSLGLAILDPSSGKFKNYPFSLQNSKLGNVVESHHLQGTSFLIGTNNGVYIADLNKTEAKPLKVGVQVRDFLAVGAQVFIVTTNEIFVYGNGILNSVFKNTGEFGRLNRLFVFEDHFYVAFDSVLKRYDKLFNITEGFSFDGKVNDLIRVNDLFWLGTAKQGLVIYEPLKASDEAVVINNKKKTTLLSNHIKCLFKDEFGVVWIGTDKGVNKIDPSKKQFLNYLSSYNSVESSNNCWSFFENDSIFISGYDNGLQIKHKQSGVFEWVSFDAPILDMVEFNADILLATGKGLYVLNAHDSIHAIDTLQDNPIATNEVVFRFLKAKGRLLIGSMSHLTICNDTLAPIGNWNYKNVRDFVYQDNRLFFVSYPTGIYEVLNLEDDDLVGCIKNSLPEVEHLLSLSIAKTNKFLWIGLYGGGLLRYDVGSKKVEHYSTKNGLPNNTVYGIIPIKDNLWLSTNGGLSQFKIEEGKFINYNTNDGLQSLEFNAGAYYRGKNDMLYFGGIKGYNIVNPSSDAINLNAPKVHVTTLIYKDQNILNKYAEGFKIDESGLKTVVIPYYKNSFKILVDGLHFSSPEENLFKTKLEGWQNDWQINKGKRSFQFSNLKEGDYFFVVKVANSDGIWSHNEERIHIVIKPPFYATWWFITIVVLVVGGLIFYVVYTKVTSSKRQREVLEKRIRSRTKEVEEQKRKLEEKNRDLEEEKNKEEEVLLNMLPRQTAKELVSTGKSTPKGYKMATVMFADFKNFTKITENLGPKELVAELDDSFAKFDDIVTKLNIEKIKTSGDAYMCVGGIPIRNQTNPVDCVLAAFQFQKYMAQKRTVREGTGKPQWHLRIGMHTGPLVAGVVGKKKFLYDVWGDAVNIAARMETSCDPGKINISGETYEYIKDYFECDHRGKLPVKNKGAIDMYYVTRIKKGLCKDDETGQTPNRKFFELLNFKVYTQQNFINVKNFFINRLETDEFVSKLKYHGPHHTLDVMEAAERIGVAEGLSEEDLMLVKVAALYHDSGFLNKYQNNEEEGAKLARRELPRYGFTDAQIEIIEEMILATKIPQSPKNHLEEILCDADLDYLGRSREEFEAISSNLAQELIDKKLLKSLDDWDPIQVKFLEAHAYFTETCTETRRPGKIERLREIKARLQGPNID